MMKGITNTTIGHMEDKDEMGNKVGYGFICIHGIGTFFGRLY
jgi:hypothetical protein